MTLETLTTIIMVLSLLLLLWFGVVMLVVIRKRNILAPNADNNLYQINSITEGRTDDSIFMISNKNRWG